ncbi:leucyl/phenylalanyl-tRNA--protein transferase [Janibacter massiliensis]|uniref:leucyl/phenylalanyl-tRNA--protein transferase n=1 Tax=Janibacter massiliensis TaxID=2058291 RepID=UPI000D0EA9B8|nr:leucyl/phenylalanyl-tRNA--protein transferase [Janibacter massiliensis]
MSPGVPFPPREVPPSAWPFDALVLEDGDERPFAGGDLDPGTLIAAYRAGFFPMGLGDEGRPPLGWWSPDPRGILPLDGLHVSRSLRRSVRRFEITVDTAFEAVLEGCADPARDGRWITPEIAAAYGRLHRLGWAHSVEVWDGEELAGGLYGVAVAGLFAGESMFHRATDASKVALVALVEMVRADGDPRRLVDVQWRTDHLASLGVVDVPRREYRRRLADALAAPPLDVVRHGPSPR